MDLRVRMAPDAPQRLSLVKSNMAKSRRPYLIRAIHEWACDNGHTPYLVVAADYPGVVVPQDYVKEGRITLNITPTAVNRLDLLTDPISFSARFSGMAFDVFIPSGAVLAVYAQETGEGVMFGEVEPPEPPEGEPAPTPQPSEEKPKRSHLRVVK